MAISIDRVVNTLTFTTSGTTAVEVVNDANEVLGWCKTIKLTMPSFESGSPSGTFSVLDRDGDALWSLTPVAQATTVVITGAEIPFAGGETVKVTLSAIPSGDATAIDVSAVAVLYFEP